MKPTSSDIAPNTTTFEDSFTTSSRKGCRSCGYALLSVMFGLVLIGIIAGQFAMLVRTDLTKSNNLLITAQANATVDAIALRVANGFLDERGKGFWKADGTAYAWRENAFDIRMTVETDSGFDQTNSHNLSASLLIELIKAHGRSAEEAKSIADDILAISQIPSRPVQVNNVSSSANIDSDNKNQSRRAQLLSIDGMDDELVNSLIHIIPFSPTSSGPIDDSRQNEETIEPSFDGKLSVTASDTQNGIVRLGDTNKTQNAPLSAIQMKIRLQQSGNMVVDINVRITLTAPKETPLQILRM